MSTLAVGIQAALLLARGRAEGLVRLTSQPDAAMGLAARSFWALPVALPGFVALHVMDWAVSGQAGGAGGVGAQGFARDLLGFVIGWLAFALLSHRVAGVTGRQALWPRFISAWNWCNVIQYLMLVVASLPALLGLPGWLVQTCWLVAMGWALWLEYFATRLALAMSPRQAVGMVALDFGLGMAIAFVIGGAG